MRVTLRPPNEAGRAVGVVIASVAVVIALVALVVALTNNTTKHAPRVSTPVPMATVPLVEVPRVVGKPQVQALGQLHAAGLTANVVAGGPYQKAVTREVVVSQSPRAGAVVPSGSTVRLYVVP